MLPSRWLSSRVCVCVCVCVSVCLCVWELLVTSVAGTWIVSAPVALIGSSSAFSSSWSHFAGFLLLSASCTLMHIVEGLCVCLSALSSVCFFLPSRSVWTLSLLHWIRGLCHCSPKRCSFLWCCQFTAPISTFSVWWGITMDEQYSFRDGFIASQWLYSNCGQGQKQRREAVITPVVKERKKGAEKGRKWRRKVTDWENFKELSFLCMRSVVKYFKKSVFSAWLHSA